MRNGNFSMVDFFVFIFHGTDNKRNWMKNKIGRWHRWDIDMQKKRMNQKGKRKKKNEPNEWIECGNAEILGPMTNERSLWKMTMFDKRMRNNRFGFHNAQKKRRKKNEKWQKKWFREHHTLIYIFRWTPLSSSSTSFHSLSLSLHHLRQKQQHARFIDAEMKALRNDYRHLSRNSLSFIHFSPFSQIILVIFFSWAFIVRFVSIAILLSLLLPHLQQSSSSTTIFLFLDRT